MSKLITVSPSTLSRIFHAWHVPAPTSGLVLFAIRGGLPRRNPEGWVPSVEVNPAEIDYVHMRCTLGIWDVKGKRVFASPGSTVPHRDNVAKAALKGGAGANQLEPGFWQDLTKGEHLQGKLNGHEALRQTANRMYRRSPKGLPYTAKSPLYYGNPYDNLHCGWNLDGRDPGYSSAGCLVVAGTARCKRHEAPKPNQGPWKTFHRLIYAVKQSRFPLLLLPAAEIQAALSEGRDGSEGRAAAEAGTDPRAGTRLVFGSKGEAVRALQRKLIASGRYLGRADGDLGPRTYRAWNASGFVRP
jgi:hypothetical protein